MSNRRKHRDYEELNTSNMGSGNIFDMLGNIDIEKISSLLSAFNMQPQSVNRQPQPVNKQNKHVDVTGEQENSIENVDFEISEKDEILQLLSALKNTVSEQNKKKVDLLIKLYIKQIKK